MTGKGKVMAKLADFGLSTTLTPENAPSTYVGTRALMAPVKFLSVYTVISHSCNIIGGHQF